MKLVYPAIDTIQYFNAGYFPALVIENPHLFYRLVNDLYQQSSGMDGDAVLSIDDQPVPIGGKLDLLSDFFPFEINRKILLNKITGKLEKHAVLPEFYERSQQLLGTIEKYVYDLAFQQDLDLESLHLSVSSLLKASGIKLKEDYSSLGEKLLVYMDLMTEYKLAEVFVFVNLRSVISNHMLELFTENCCCRGYNFLLIDNKAGVKLPREQRTVIDEDLCEI